MKRAVVVAALVCLASMAFPAQASASLMDWLQELSGPGPFNAKRLNVIVDLCPARLKARSSGEHIFASEYEPRDVKDKPRICLFVDNRLFKNDGAGDNFGAGEIDVHAVEFGASARVHRSVSIGFGVGWIGFNAKDRGEKTTKFLVTAPRIVFKPVFIFGSEDFWKDDKHKPLRIVASMFKFYIRNNIICGKLTGADFGLKQGDPNLNFAVRHDRVWSTGFVLDLSELFTLL
jgi:hypothetical protein